MRIPTFFLIIFVFFLPKFKNKKKDDKDSNVLDLNSELDKKLNELFSFYKDVIKNSDSKENSSEKFFETLEQKANSLVKSDFLEKQSKKEFKETSFIQNSMKIETMQSEVFNYQPFVWTSFSVKKTGPSPRRGHSAVLADTYMVIFGGCYMESKCYNDVYFLELRTQTWIYVPTTGEIPSPRQGHTATLYGSIMWVYGGSSGNGYFSELYSLNLETVYIFLH